jgi:quinol monooxygenase YgiN
MVSFVVRMRFKPEDRADIEQIMHGLTPPSRAEEGCVTYIPHWMESEPSTLLIYEQYVDEAALEFHRSSPHFAKYGTGGLLQKMLGRELDYLHVIE